jgi:hypothetical protein
MKSKQCEAHIGEIAAYLAGETALSEDATVHLKECAECRAKVAELRAVVTIHGDGAARIAEPRRRLSRKMLVRSLGAEEQRGMGFNWLRPVLAASAVVVVVAASLMLRDKPIESMEAPVVAGREAESASEGAAPAQTILALHQEVRDGRELLLVSGRGGSGLKHYRVRDVESELGNLGE